MNKHLCEILLPKDIVFNRKFEDHSTWTEAFSNNISAVVFDYNKNKNSPLIRCKDFTLVQPEDKIERMEKFVGKVICKYDEDYSMVHVWFSTTDNDTHYMYLGCIKETELNEVGITVHKGW
jgi:hypothetical protein